VVSLLTEARGSSNIQRVVEHILANGRSYQGSPEELVAGATKAVDELIRTPLAVETTLEWGGRVTHSEGLSVASRVNLALKLWEFLKAPELAALAEELSRQFDDESNYDVAFNENIEPVELLATKPYQRCPTRRQIVAAVMKHVFDDPYRNGRRPPMRDMAQMTEFFSVAPSKFPDDVKRLSEAAKEAFEEIQSEVDDCTSTIELESLRWQVDRLAELLEVDSSEFDEMFDEREAQLQEDDYDPDDFPSEGPGSPVLRDDSDAAIVSLFSTLH
jgi:hypothetical protein